PDGPAHPVPVIPVVVTLALAAASGGTYLLADSTAATMADQSTPEGLTAVRTKTNLLVFASGATLAGAVGVAVGGVLLSVDGVHVRF
ncbi:MAG: hypothetical protein ABMB14_34135, partial [Myxococcota bacterium]